MDNIPRLKALNHSIQKFTNRILSSVAHEAQEQFRPQFLFKVMRSVPVGYPGNVEWWRSSQTPRGLVSVFSKIINPNFYKTFTSYSFISGRNAIFEKRLV